MARVHRAEMKRRPSHELSGLEKDVLFPNSHSFLAINRMSLSHFSGRTTVWDKRPIDPLKVHNPVLFIENFI